MKEVFTQYPKGARKSRTKLTTTVDAFHAVLLPRRRTKPICSRPKSYSNFSSSKFLSTIFVCSSQYRIFSLLISNVLAIEEFAISFDKKPETRGYLRYFSNRLCKSITRCGMCSATVWRSPSLVSVQPIRHYEESVLPAHAGPLTYPHIVGLD